MNQDNSFVQNIMGVQNLIGSSENKTVLKDGENEGVEGEYTDVLELDMTDDELITLRDSYELKSSPYISKIKPRQELNKIYYKGKQKSNGGTQDKVIPSNLIFESVETFIPQATKIMEGIVIRPEHERIDSCVGRISLKLKSEKYNLFKK